MEPFNAAVAYQQQYQRMLQAQQAEIRLAQLQQQRMLLQTQSQAIPGQPPKAQQKPIKAPAPPPPPPKEDDDEADLGDGLEGAQFTHVSTIELEKAGLRPHPDKIAEAGALADVAIPQTTHKLGLPPHVLVNGISALQFQAVRLACAKHEHTLPDGTRAGFFLGDGPGVGKGRQIAALVFENILRGRKKAVWFSVSADLATDAKRDFNDIGALDYETVEIHDLKRLKVKPGGKLADLPNMESGILFSTYDMLIAGSKRKAAAKKEPQPATQAAQVDENMAFDGHFYTHGPPAEPEPVESEFGECSRLQQIVDWFGPDYDGAIVFDECHRAKNCIPKEADKDTGKDRAAESKTSRAVVEIQRRLPNARVLYVSATGATDPENLCYMTRLGLWGDKTSFSNKEHFVNMLKHRGVGAMELVASELKQNGLFIARTLSYEGVTFDQVHIDISLEYREMYNAAADLWQEITEATQAAHALINLNGPKAFMSTMRQLYGAQLRFFRQLCTASKVEEVERQTKDALAHERCVVIGLQNTGEARTEAMVAANGGDDASFDAFAEASGLVMQSFIKKFLPDASAHKRELLRKTAALRTILPQNPLDDLIDRLGGVDVVAEMTGRKRRMVRGPPNADGDTEIFYKSRAIDGQPMDKINMIEKAAFQSGKKLIAIISDAASTGISLQADRHVENQRHRVHITLELAWSADKTVQQLGRTHRSNQVQPPQYVIISSDISGEQRFASAVAKRLEGLGALTHGDRHATSAADALSSANLQNVYGTRALRIMYRVLLERNAPPANATPDFIIEGLDPQNPTYEADKRRRWREFIPRAREALCKVGILDADAAMGEELNKVSDKSKEGKSGNITKLLNRLLGVHVEMQSQIFNYFITLQEAEIHEAKKLGKYNEYGIIKPCGNIQFVKEQVVYTNGYSGMQTRHYEFAIDRGCDYKTAVERVQQELAEDPETSSGFYYSIHEGAKMYLLAIERSANGRKLGKVKKGKKKRETPAYYRLIRPATGFSATDMPAAQFFEKYRRVKEDKQESEWMKQRWTSEFKADKYKRRKQPLHIITGSTLQLLPTLFELFSHTKVEGRTVNLQVYRVETSDGAMQQVGIYIPHQIIGKVLAAIQTVAAQQPGQFDSEAGVKGPGALAEITNTAGSALEAVAFKAAAPADLKKPQATVAEALDDDSDFDEEAENSGKKAKTVRRPRLGGKRGKRVAGDKLLAMSAGPDSDLPAELQDALATSGLWESLELPALKSKEKLRAATAGLPAFNPELQAKARAAAASKAAAWTAKANKAERKAEKAEGSKAAADGPAVEGKRPRKATAKAVELAPEAPASAANKGSQPKASAAEDDADSSSSGSEPDEAAPAVAEHTSAKAKAKAKLTREEALAVLGHDKKAEKAAAAAAEAVSDVGAESSSDSSDSDDDDVAPENGSASAAPAKQHGGYGSGSETDASSDSDNDDAPLAQRPKRGKAAAKHAKQVKGRKAKGAAKAEVNESESSLDDSGSDGSSESGSDPGSEDKAASGSEAEKPPGRLKAARSRVLDRIKAKKGTKTRASSTTPAKRPKSADQESDSESEELGSARKKHASQKRGGRSTLRKRSLAGRKAAGAAGSDDEMQSGAGTASEPEASPLVKRKLNGAARKNMDGKPPTFQMCTASEISEGWKVRCPCGVQTYDGEEMLECEDCKIWQHTRCTGVTDIAAPFFCTFCHDSAASAKGATPAAAPLEASNRSADAACAAKASKRSAAGPVSTKTAAAGSDESGSDGDGADTVANKPARAARHCSDGAGDADVAAVGQDASQDAGDSATQEWQLAAAERASSEVGGAMRKNKGPKATQKAEGKLKVKDGRVSKHKGKARAHSPSKSEASNRRSVDELAAKMREWESKASQLEAALEEERAKHRAQVEEVRLQGEVGAQARMEAAVAERVKQEKLPAMRKAMEMGIKKGTEAAELSLRSERKTYIKATQAAQAEQAALQKAAAQAEAKARAQQTALQQATAQAEVEAKARQAALDKATAQQKAAAETAAAEAKARQQAQQEARAHQAALEVAAAEAQAQREEVQRLTRENEAMQAELALLRANAAAAAVVQLRSTEKPALSDSSDASEAAAEASTPGAHTAGGHGHLRRPDLSSQAVSPAVSAAEGAAASAAVTPASHTAAGKLLTGVCMDPMEAATPAPMTVDRFGEQTPGGAGGKRVSWAAEMEEVYTIEPRKLADQVTISPSAVMELLGKRTGRQASLEHIMASLDPSVTRGAVLEVLEGLMGDFDIYCKGGMYALL